MYFFLPLFSTNYSSILPHFILSSISLYTSWLFPIYVLIFNPEILSGRIFFLIFRNVCGLLLHIASAYVNGVNNERKKSTTF
jgi:hypothetical protein